MATEIHNMEARDVIDLSEQQIEKHQLFDVRVIQKNLVYAIGIPQRFAEESVLKRFEYFGQFGQIIKLVVNKRSGTDSTASAYISYASALEATDCIRECDESLLDGKVIKCTYGTTKYCSFYLKGISCQNIDCMYLHFKGEDQCSLTKDEMGNSKHKLHDFDGSNRNKQRIGRTTEFEEILDHLYMFRPEKQFREPDFINFEPHEFL